MPNLFQHQLVGSFGKCVIVSVWLFVSGLSLSAALEQAMPELRPPKAELTQTQEPRSYKWYWLFGATLCSAGALVVYGVLHRPKNVWVPPYVEACKVFDAQKGPPNPAVIWETLRAYLLATFSIENPGVTASELVRQLSRRSGMTRQMLDDLTAVLGECETARFSPETKVDPHLLERAVAVLNHVEARSIPAAELGHE